MVAVTLFNKDGGLFYDWDELAFKKLGWNLLGAVVITAWSLFWGLAIFMSLRLLGILRVDRDIEIKGRFLHEISISRRSNCTEQIEGVCSSISPWFIKLIGKWFGTIQLFDPRK